MSLTGLDLRTFVAEGLLSRNAASRVLFSREAERLARACELMSERFLRGGRLLAFGRGAAATDAQHVAVEFVHPVLVGKRALPAVDLSRTFEHSLAALVGAADIVMAFAGDDDSVVDAALDAARAAGAQTFALPGRADTTPRDPLHFALDRPSPDPFVAQELIEILYHTLWETVHVFFEHSGVRAGRGVPSDQARQDDLGASAFLYPFLGDARQSTSSIIGEVAASIRAKASDDERLREEIANGQADRIAEAIGAGHRRITAGGSVLIFGNGGSATDANDWAIDCVAPGRGMRRVAALSLSMDPATLTAIANDVGVEAVFLRQLIAYGRPGDVAIAMSTSGGSANVIAALEEARKRRMLTVALLGYDGGEIVRRGLADLPIVVACDYIPRIQEVQASIYHLMTEAWREWIN